MVITEAQILKAIKLTEDKVKDTEWLRVATSIDGEKIVSMLVKTEKGKQDLLDHGWMEDTKFDTKTIIFTLDELSI